MKKLSVDQLETTVGGGKLRTCFIGGMLTAVGIGIGFGTGGFWGAGAALTAALAAANYNGCL